MLAAPHCLQVVDEFDQGQGLIQGNITSGMRPYGKLCGSKDFQYTATYGPFSECGRRKVRALAGNGSECACMHVCVQASAACWRIISA